MANKGEAELGIAAEISEEWDRLDTWPLFTENFQLVVNKNHPLAARDKIDFVDLRAEQLLSRNYCEHGARVNSSLREHGLDVDRSHEIASERDLIELLEADIGVAGGRIVALARGQEAELEFHRLGGFEDLQCPPLVYLSSLELR